MSRRTILYLVISALAAALFVRLGVWQISRLHERRARNAVIAARLAEPPASVQTLRGDTAEVRFRRVRVAGRLDYAHEFVIPHSHQGSPGVYLVTPAHIAGSDTAVLVNRGWIYSPDGRHADLSRWHEGDTVDASGWVDVPPSRAGSPALGASPLAFKWIDAAFVGHALGIAVTPYYVVLDSVAAASPDRPARLSQPALDEGPHKSYAIQWFCFAAVSIIGAIVFARKQPGA